MFGTPNSILATMDHDVHRRRRNAYANYYSKQFIKRYSNVIQIAFDRLCTMFENYNGSGKKISLLHAYTTLAGDIAREFCFPKSYDLLDRPNLAPDYFELRVSILDNSHVLKQFPWTFPLYAVLSRVVRGAIPPRSRAQLQVASRMA